MIPKHTVQLGSDCSPHASHEWEIWTLSPRSQPPCIELRCEVCESRQWFLLIPDNSLRASTPRPELSHNEVDNVDVEV